MSAFDWGAPFEFEREEHRDAVEAAYRAGEIEDPPTLRDVCGYDDRPEDDEDYDHE